MTTIKQALAPNVKWGRDIAPGDCVYLDGSETSPVVVTRVGNGLVAGCVLVEWAGGWGHARRNNTYQVEPA